MLNFKETAFVTIILFFIIEVIRSILIILKLKARSGTIQSGKATILAWIILIAINIKLLKINPFMI